jgi:hypothetical protein
MLMDNLGLRQIIEEKSEAPPFDGLAAVRATDW